MQSGNTTRSGVQNHFPHQVTQDPNMVVAGGWWLD
jgi:hypothetical protein